MFVYVIGICTGQCVAKANVVMLCSIFFYTVVFSNVILVEKLKRLQGIVNSKLKYDK